MHKLLYFFVLLMYVNQTSTLHGCVARKYRSFNCENESLEKIKILAKMNGPLHVKNETIIIGCIGNEIPERLLPYKNLKWLTISCGEITDIHGDAFAELNLVSLNLTNNSLAEDRNGAIKKLTELEILDLSINKFKTIVPDLLEGLNNLKELNMSYNQLESLGQGIFDDLERLEKFNASHNNIQFIGRDIFYRNSHLSVVDLSYNSLRQLTEQLFIYNYELKFLNVSHNKITIVPINIFSQSALEVLDLSYNKIESIKIEFLQLDTLRELHVQNNHLIHFGIGPSGPTKTKIRHIDLRHNRLVYLENNLLERLGNLPVFRIEANPWDCKCFEKILGSLKGRTSEYISLDYSEGRKPVCVVGDNSECKINTNNLSMYYNKYSSALYGNDVIPRLV